jgi:hypothetical protein
MKIVRHRDLFERTSVKIVAGPHAGREGNLVSIPWFANLWNIRPTINVSANEDEIRSKFVGKNYQNSLIKQISEGYGPRHWVSVWNWQIEEQKKDGR